MPKRKSNIGRTTRRTRWMKISRKNMKQHIQESKSRQETNNNFWAELSKAIGPISFTVQSALELTQFIHSGLASLDNAAIDRIEEDIRRLPARMVKSESEVAQLLRINPSEVKDFRFLTGERSVMLEVAARIGQNGFFRYYRTAERVERKTPVLAELPAPPPPVFDHQAVANNHEMEGVNREVYVKILDYYEKRSYKIQNYGEFFAKLAKLRVETNMDSIGEMALVTCPFCDPKNASTAMIRRDRSGTWKVWNFNSHIKTKHEGFLGPGGLDAGYSNGTDSSYHMLSDSSGCGGGGGEPGAGPSARKRSYHRASSDNLQEEGDAFEVDLDYSQSVVKTELTECNGSGCGARWN
ncbi:uncharacterized protein LOC129759770 isoform X2 [Uranotaenia lowii]|uniref:uncharacterized protein LOC129759770 isoform X2 n=1 Tax=Uranotaenia lowii TaxID=190385 RepID=UPI0024792C1D|nr:uncharacterized protein LOC129759770 isoform X2 [Uranotaenia lowii]